MTDLDIQKIQISVDQASKVLPAQGPLGVFVHHNTLHSYEGLPFEEAVVQASKLLKCQPFMPEAWYRDEYRRGRIVDLDLQTIVAERTIEGVHFAKPNGLRELRLALLRYPLHQVDGAALRWHLNETGALWRFRQEIDVRLRQRMTQQTLQWLKHSPQTMTHRVGPLPDDWDTVSLPSLLKKYPEKVAVRALWTSSKNAISTLDLRQFQAREEKKSLRHRDYLMNAGGGDADSLVNPFLIRFCAAFLDQGVADVPMPNRSRGIFTCFLDIYGQAGGLLPRWLQGLQETIQEVRQSALSAEQCALESLQILGVSAQTAADFVRETLLVLRGWAGMIHQANLRPDRLPVEQVPANLMDYLAVRLLLERFALRRLLHELQSGHVTLGELRRVFPLPRPVPPSQTSMAFQFHQVAQFLGLCPEQIQAMSPTQVSELLQAVLSFDQIERRKFFHLAYERHFRTGTLDALQLHLPIPRPAQGVSFQAIFCIDEREESTRRHLEEVAPTCETFGTLGYFSIPMYFKAVHEPHPVALCPVSIQPRHLVTEVINPSSQEEAQKRATLRRSLSQVANHLEVGSKSLGWGSLLTSVLGMISALPALVRVLLPWQAGKFERKLRTTLLPSDTHLEIERQVCEGFSEQGLLNGFSVEEMTDIVAFELENMGLRHFGPLVLVIGHGSSSLNNPHEAAYDCGACGGGRGGPNARAFAWMGNHPAVRAQLAQRGLNLPIETCFVGAYHNTCAEDIDLYDLKDLNSEQVKHLEVALLALQEARGRDALERCRRFVSASFDMTPRQALLHVEERAADLAQPRPECGHATNAICMVGRRSRTRGLFLDRRAFLVSYDPTQDDPQGTLLGRLLCAVVPVGSGISLEYYFSSVDNEGYGCGTKLPHNITGLIGVMDGYSSDLRTGLPKQMVEIHEPMRLLVVIESTTTLLEVVLSREDSVRRLVSNGWVQVALLSPDSQEILVWSPTGWQAHERQSYKLSAVADSQQWFHHQRGSLDFAEIKPNSPAQC
ncbi:DUF2309 domain-containing protein [bacterium]|nr:DUF2309 domain-containing protein [bacterium]